jgi:hypothetical protein
MPNQRNLEPKVSIEQSSLVPGAKAGIWVLTWKVTNLSPEPLTILAARLPHSLFRSPERQFSPGHKILPDQSANLGCPVECTGAPGQSVENAFIILLVTWLEQPWRVLARLRVVMDERGAPHSVTELVTVQQVGFSRKL